jgi:acyl-coenzyme A thioesterase PaaI-like protein
LGRPISTEYASGRKILTGISDPSGLRLVFELDGNRVFCHVDANEALCGRAKVVPAGVVQSVVDDLAHATVAALKKRIGVTRECRIRFLKPLYGGESFRADGTLFRDGSPSGAGDILVVQARFMNKREQLCVEAETEVFPLSAEQVRRMTPDGMVPAELRKYLP